MLGCLLGALSLYPAYHGIAYLVNPDLVYAMGAFPVKVIAYSEDCSLRLIPSEIRDHIKISSSCDLAKNVLNEYGISYANEDGVKGSLAKVVVGNMTVESIDLSGLNVKLKNSCRKASF